MSNPFGDLTAENADQIRKYLKFFRQKKDATVRSINSEINSVMQDRLNDDMYSKEDVVDFAELLKSTIKNQVTADLSTTINMSALAVSQLLGNAQSAGVDLVLDTSCVENALLLEAVERMSLDHMGGRAPGKVGKLTSLKDDAKALKDESDRLENNNKQLQERYQVAQERASQAQTEASKLLKEKKYLTDELSKLQVKIDNLDSDAKGGSDANRKLQQLEGELESAHEENAKRVNDTAQFQQMKKLMQSQSVKIKDLRKRLQKYEPDDCKGGDDDL